MTRVVIFAYAVVACSHEPVAPSAKATPCSSNEGSAASPAGCPGAAPSTSPALSHLAGDPPEPTPPELECAFERKVSCRPGPPTRTAMQRPPFEWCAREVPLTRAPFYPGDALRFSAVETRLARKTTPDACCYVELVASACD